MNNPFSQMSWTRTNNNINQLAFEQFDRGFIIDALNDKRYGQAFCEYFNIGNATPLYWFKDYKIAKRWITENYIA